MLFYSGKFQSSLDLSQRRGGAELLKFCVFSKMPTRSIYQFCDEQFSEKNAKDRCTIDSCFLCCSMSTDLFNYEDIDDENVADCKKSCMEELLAD